VIEPMNESEFASELEGDGLSLSESLTSENRQAAMAELVRQHNEELVNYISRWVRSRTDACDIAQEAYAQIFKVGDRNVVSHLRGYLYKTAKNIASNWMRSRIRRESLLEEEFLRKGEEDRRTPEEICVARQELEIVRQAFEKLSPRMRTAVYLIKEVGLSYEETGARLNIKPASARRLVERAMDFLSDAVSKGNVGARGPG